MLRKHPEWTILTGLIPVALAAGIFEILVDPELVNLLVSDLGRGLGFAAPFVQELLMMSTLTVCYVVLCLALLGYFSVGFARSALSAQTKWTVGSAGIASWIGFHAVLVGLSAFDLRLFSVTYDSLVQFYERAGSPVAEAMTGHMLAPGISRHLASILLPASIGVAAVCAGACHAIATVQQARAGTRKPEQAVDRLLHGFMAMSGLLVGSTLLLTLSFRLPAGLYGTGEMADTRIAEYLEFADTVSVFWGVVFTLTLVAVYAPHVLALRSFSEMSLSQMLNKGLESGLLNESWVKKTEVAVSALAPLIAALTAYLM